MSLENSNLAEAFEALADDRQAPASAIDYERAMSHGQRALRLRRTAGGLTAAVTLALAATLTGILPPIPGTGGEAAGPTPPAHGVDPLVVHVEFGWVPSTLTVAGYGAAPGNTSAMMTAPEPANGSDQSASIDLTVFSNFSSASPGGGGPTTQVGELNGYPVQYSTGPISLTAARGYISSVNPSTCKQEPAKPVPTLAQEGIQSEGLTSLLWHTASGQVALLDYVYVDQPAPDAATMLHIAETATYEPKAVPMPFSITGVNPAAPLDASVTMNASPLPTSSNLSYTVGDTLVSISVNPLPIMAPSFCPKISGGAEADKVINGLQFLVNETSISNPQGAVNTSKAGTPASILARITAYGADPTKWTSHVLAQ